MHTEIPTAQQLTNQVFSITSEKSFEAAALAVFGFQYQHNDLYRSYCQLLNKKTEQVRNISDIPFLPISFFKSHTVTTTHFEAELLFESSGTTGQQPSRHWVRSKALYELSFQKGFEASYGHPEDYCIIGLLPSYLERGQSSLVYMVNNLVEQSKHPHSGFYLYDFEKLAETLHQLEAQRQQTWLIGVTYALLDFAERFPMPLQHTMIVETGGMKGRKKELLRDEVHAYLAQAFGANEIHSEYGMTELLSQAYAKQNGIFRTPPWMKVLLRAEDDPLSATSGKSGGINVIDLANIFSCSFIATEDMGRLEAGGGFSVLGRLDNAEIRGCSLISI